MDSEEIKQQFSAQAALPDDEIDLARAALLIAATEYPSLDVEQQLGVLDSLSRAASTRIGDRSNALACVNSLSEYLFDELGFQGNQDYYDPRNSYLNEVLDRRLGIPITLSLVCIEVGRRLEIPLVGVGMPGHFLLKHWDEQELFIDPFNRGIILSEEECAQRLRQVTQANVAWDSRYLATVSNREFIVRILRNLKGIYLGREDHRRAVDIIDMLLVLRPNAVEELRDRGLARYQLGQYAEALDDLRQYTDAAPAGSDAEGVQRLIGRIQDLLGG